MELDDDLVYLGFVEDLSDSPSEAHILLPEYFPSKIGGKPSWIGGPLLDVEQSQCPVCFKTMPMLLQVYAPLNRINEEAYHRMIFVLCCRNPSCHHSSTSAFRVFRSQLAKDNKFIIDFEEDDEENEESDDPLQEEPDAEKFTYLDAICEICGWRAKNKCAKCKNVRYCGREHQLLDWNNGHQAECKIITEKKQEENVQQEKKPTDSKTNSDSPIQQRRKSVQIIEKSNRRFPLRYLYKEFNIVTEPEDEKTSALLHKLQLNHDLDNQFLLTDSNQTATAGRDIEEEDDEDEDVVRERTNEQLEILEQYKNRCRDFQGENFDDEEWDQANKIDGNFIIFQEIIEKNRTQILRYGFGTEPLWIHSKNKPTAIPPCQNCGALRKFEFQVLPQLLHYLSLEKKISLESIDWGTLLVYSCSNSCSMNDKAVHEEFLWRQQLEQLQPQFFDTQQ